MDELSDTMDELRESIESDAEGLVNGEGGPLIDNIVFRVGLYMLTPGSPVAVETVANARVAARGLRMFVKAAVQRAKWQLLPLLPSADSA